MTRRQETWTDRVNSHRHLPIAHVGSGVPGSTPDSHLPEPQRPQNRDQHMTEFTASNGTLIWRAATGRLTLGNYMWFTSSEESALREFFQHERDEERGIWRSHSDSSWTAVRRNTTIYFQNEDHERSFHFIPKLEASIKAWSPDLQSLAYEWIEAHPERKPWEDAEEGQVWIIAYNGREFPAIFQAGAFRDHGGSWSADAITAARRIWPEEAS